MRKTAIQSKFLHQVHAVLFLRGKFVRYLVMGESLEFWGKMHDRHHPIRCVVGYLPWPIQQRTRRMAIANGTCVSFCNQPKAQFTSGESRRYVVAFTRFAGGGIWLPQESLRHILASTGYALGTIVVNVTWMEREFNAGQKHGSMYRCTHYLQPFMSYSEILVGNSNFYLPLAFNAPVGGVPIKIPGKSLDPRKTDAR